MKSSDCLIGSLLKLERTKQEKSQREICYGICVPSYLSKIEKGSVSADKKILEKLFQKLEIHYEINPEFTSAYRVKLEEYYHKIYFNFEAEECYQELLKKDMELSHSELAIDWLIIKSQKDEYTTLLLKEIENQMTVKQKSKFQVFCGQHNFFDFNEEEFKEFEEACEILNQSYGYLLLCYQYLNRGEYAAIHRLENRIVTMALQEGNLFSLADYYMIRGSAYGCLDMDEMMMDYYGRVISLLENTGWREKLVDIYYNIGATLISLKNYDVALTYLGKAEEEFEICGSSIYHKKAIALIRMGRIEEATQELDQMKNVMEKNELTLSADWLKYQEACMECHEGYMHNPEYLTLLEELIEAIKKDYHFGHLYFYREIIIDTYVAQRKYKKALEFEQKLSLVVRKNNA